MAFCPPGQPLLDDLEGSQDLGEHAQENRAINTGRKYVYLMARRCNPPYGRKVGKWEVLRGITARCTGCSITEAIRAGAPRYGIRVGVSVWGNTVDGAPRGSAFAVRFSANNQRLCSIGRCSGSNARHHAFLITQHVKASFSKNSMQSLSSSA